MKQVKAFYHFIVMNLLGFLELTGRTLWDLQVGVWVTSKSTYHSNLSLLSFSFLSVPPLSVWRLGLSIDPSCFLTLATKPSLASNKWSLCFCHPNAAITGVCCHTQLSEPSFSGYPSFKNPSFCNLHYMDALNFLTNALCQEHWKRTIFQGEVTSIILRSVYELSHILLPAMYYPKYPAKQSIDFFRMDDVDRLLTASSLNLPS